MAAVLKQCALCLQDKQLQTSHIIPAFAGRYLKETSATGYLRAGSDPNIRRQDVPKEPLLCKDCEQTFSTFEREFHRKAFPLVQRDDYRELEYDLWLLKFAVSINWRILTVDRVMLEADVPHFKHAIASALENWRLFLLGKRRQPGGEHHLFVVAGVPASMSKNVHPRTLDYFLRSVDATALVTDKWIGVYGKIIRSIFYSPVVPPSAPGWKNTRIHAGPGRLISPQELSMPGLMEFLQARITQVHSQGVSERQRKKISEAMLKNPERTLTSESFKVHQATRRLLGPV